MGQAIQVSPREKAQFWRGDGPAKWQRLHVSYNSPGLVGVAGTTGNVDFTGYQAGVLILGAFFRNTVDWVGAPGGINAVTLSCGTTSSAAAYIAATSVFTGVSPLTKTGVSLATGTFLGGTGAGPLAASTVRVQVITTNGNLSTLTAGQTDVYLLLSAIELLG